MKFYVLPVNINLYDPSPVKLRLSEGPFDILSIKYNLVGKNDRSIFAAIGGSSYNGCIRYFLTHMGLYNLEVHIYMDNDQTMNQMYNIAGLLIYFNIPLFIHNNSYPNEKDYGVPANRIIDNIRQI